MNKKLFDNIKYPLWLKTLQDVDTEGTWKWKWKSLSRVWVFEIPWTVAYQASLSMGFSRQEYWSGLPFPSPGDLPDSGIKPGSPALEGDALTSEPPGKPIYYKYCVIMTHLITHFHISRLLGCYRFLFQWTSLHLAVGLWERWHHWVTECV